MTIIRITNPILVLDDDHQTLDVVEQMLRAAGYSLIHTCADPHQAKSLVQQNDYSVLLLDLVMPGISGQEILTHARERHPEMVVIILTGTTNLGTAVQCMKLGAFDYLVKPVSRSVLLAAVERAFEVWALREEVEHVRARLLSDELEHPEAFADLITQDPRLIKTFQYIETVAASRRPLLITGETGTGKGLLAKALYRLSGCSGSLVSVNVAGLDDSLFSDTLFGHVRGAFTGAETPRSGFVEYARDGILFLDEMGELSLASQVKLLQLLEDGVYYQLGSDVPKESAARVVCATNRDLDKAVEQGDFRQDLLFRLRTHRVHMPPLRERPGDLPALVRHFVEEAAEEFEKPPPPIPDDFHAMLANYDFPGNVRELEAIVAEAVSAHRSGSLPVGFVRELLIGRRKRTVLQSTEVPAKANGGIALPNPMPTLEELTDFAIQEAMARAGGNQTTAARILGISRTTLNARLRKSSRSK